MLNSAKKFAMKNKEKIAAGVDKATDVIDKKTKGKHHDKLEKADAAAAKFAGKPKQPAVADTETPAPQPATPVDDATKPSASPDPT
jgi:MT0933-like antitoxin protein